MSEKRQSAAKKTAEKEVSPTDLEVALRSEGSSLPDKALGIEENYRRRKEEVTRQDHEEFLRYLQERAQQETAAEADAPQAKPTKVNRRNFLPGCDGTAAVGEAVALGYSNVKDQTIPAHGARHAGDNYTEAQRHNIERELI